jgi:hypothetical protein
MADFTPTQGRYLAFIRAYTYLHGYPPAESEIAGAMCVSPPSVDRASHPNRHLPAYHQAGGQISAAVWCRIEDAQLGETMSDANKKRKKAHPKRRQTAAEKRARRERKKKFMTIFINGKQKRVPRPPLIDGLPVEEFIAQNADPIWLHENELWECMTPDDTI